MAKRGPTISPPPKPTVVAFDQPTQPLFPPTTTNKPGEPTSDCGSDSTDLMDETAKAPQGGKSPSPPIQGSGPPPPPTRTIPKIGKDVVLGFDNPTLPMVDVDATIGMDDFDATISPVPARRSPSPPQLSRRVSSPHPQTPPLEEDEDALDELLSDMPPELARQNSQANAAPSKPKVGGVANLWMKKTNSSSGITKKPTNPLSQHSTSAVAAHSLAFPSLCEEPTTSSTSGGFPPQKVAAIAGEVLSSFLKKHSNPNVRLYLVESGGSGVTAFAKIKNKIGDNRFHVINGKITEMKTAGMPCCYLCNSTNWRFKKPGPVHTTAGKTLEEDTKQQYNTGEVGKAYPVALSPASPLASEGVRHVIHVVTPNLNPNKADCITDESKAETLVRSCYESLLSSFAVLCGLESPSSAVTPPPQKQSQAPTTTTSSSSSSANTTNSATSPGMIKLARYFPPAGPPAAVGGNWKNALLEIVKHRQKHPKLVYYEDSKCAVVYDAYPKATVHLLILPLDLKLLHIGMLNRSHVDLVKHMDTVGNQIVRHLRETQFKALTFKVGYHSIPSMNLLHCHVISQDFHKAEALKKKKHWNSFTTDFFLPSSSVIQMLEQGGTVEIDKAKAKQLEEQDLQCHLCGSSMKNLPKLKQHYTTCLFQRQASM